MVLVGGNYAPCMRMDATIEKEIMVARGEERETACCVRKDDGACYQGMEKDCIQDSSNTETFNKWPQHSSKISDEWTTGTVCGLDPRFCLSPPGGVHSWSKSDLTQWPVCEEFDWRVDTCIGDFRSPNCSIPDHMSCEIVARPCCFGIRGKCQILTQTWCDLLQGKFHTDKQLCSHVGGCLGRSRWIMPFFRWTV